MRKLFLRLGMLCAFAFALVYAFGAFLTPLWQKFDDPVHAQNSVRLYLLLGAATFTGLYLIKKLTGLVIVLLLAILLFLFFYFDVFHWINLFG